MNPVIFLVRHGRTEFNVKGLFRGEADIPLTAAGLKDADEAIKFLQDENVDVAFLVSSDKKRAVQTANKIGAAFDLPNKETSDLRAWNLGDFSGEPKNKENLEKLEQYVKNPDLPVPGGESLNEFRGRILPVLAECFEYATRNGVGIVVAHSSVVHELGNQIFGNHKSLVVKPGGIVVVGFGDGDITAERIFKPLLHHEGAASVS